MSRAISTTGSHDTRFERRSTGYDITRVTITTAIRAIQTGRSNATTGASRAPSTITARLREINTMKTSQPPTGTGGRPSTGRRVRASATEASMVVAMKIANASPLPMKTIGR